MRAQTRDLRTNASRRYFASKAAGTLCVCVCVYTCIQPCVSHACTHTCVCMCVCIYKDVPTRACVSVFVCIQGCAHTCVYVP
jgi:hypothetical protein